MRLLIFLISFLVAGNLKSQPSLVFTPIVSENGLLENRVRNLNQLPDGRMVVVTEGVINLYNGSYFQNIHINEEKTIKLSGYSGFHHSYTDSENRLWVKNSGRLMLVDIKKERFEDAPTEVLRNIGIPTGLGDFFIDSYQNLWFVTVDGKLWVQDRNTKQTRVFRTNISKCAGLNDQLYDLAQIDDVVYLFYKSGYIVQLAYSSGKQLAVTNSLPAQKRSLYSRTLYVLQNKGKLYQIRNGNHGILQSYNAGTGQWITLLETSYWLNSLVVDKDGNIWVSSRDGLWFLDKSLRKKHLFPSLQLVDGKSIQTEVSTLFMDKLGSLWIGTLNRGLLYYHPDRFKFRNIGRTLFGLAPDAALFVNTLADDGPTNVLAGTNKGVFSYNSTTSRVRKYDQLPDQTSCKSIYKDRSGRTWLGCSDGLYLITKTGSKLYPVKNVQGFYETGKGELLLCTQDNGFGRFDLKTGNYQPMELNNDKSLAGAVYQLIEWNDLFLGISGTKIFEYHTKNKTIRFPHNAVNKPAMYHHNNHQYNVLLKDKRGCLWFGTQDGLNIWDPKTAKSYTLNNTDGLVGNNIKTLAEDKKGNIWTSTSSGISSIAVTRNRQSLLKFAIVNYNTYNGVIAGEFIERAAYLGHNSTFLAGGIDGFNIVNTDNVAGTDLSFKPLLSYFQLFGKRVSINSAYDGNVVLPSSMATTQKIKLKHNQNFFTIGFTALNYINPTQTFYRYKLEGVDNTWREVSYLPGMGEAIYTDLAPGKYLFKVKAASSPDFQGKDETQLIIEIDAPFWNTVAAKIFYILLLIILFIYFLKRYIRRKHLRILHSQQVKVEEIKANFFTNISHELRTPLTLILSPLEAVLSKLDDGQVKNQLKGVQRNASRLLDLVNQLLEFRKLEATGEKLNLTYCNISEYLEAYCRQFEEQASSKKITFKWEVEPGLHALFIDKIKLDRILNNLLSNAFKFTPTGGTVTLQALISVMPNSGTEALQLCVEDTGIGIPAKDLPYIFKRFFQASNQTSEHTGSGIGLYMVREYVSLHGGVIEAESKVNRGSRFVIYLPSNRRAEPEYADQKADYSEKETEKAKILIIEDNEEFRIFLAAELSDDYYVAAAADGLEGLSLVYELQPDVVISDVMMPLMNGTELCRKLKADIRISHTSVILLTAQSSDNAQIEGYEAGADAFVSKPFSLNILRLRIKKLIEQQEARKALFRKAIVIQPDALTTTSIDEKLVHKALKCVDENIRNSNYSVEQLSRDMNMDRTGLYRKLVSLTGQTPTAFIRSVRLKRAAHLILKNEYTIGEVAELVGFNNAAYFSKAFQEEFGVKPSQYSNKTQ